MTTNDTHIIFGTGPVGLTLADLLLAQGKTVRIVSRSGKAKVAAGIEHIAADATDAAKVEQLCRGAAVAYNCMNASSYAAQAVELPIQQRAMIDGVGASGAKLVVTNSLYMYGETHGQTMTEASPHSATNKKGRLHAEMAAGYLQTHKDGKLEVALGRAADFFGPRVTNSSLGGYVFPNVLAGKPAQLLGDIDLPHSYSYMPDVARGLATLADHPEAFGRDWLLPVADPVPTTRQMLTLIEQATGKPVRPQTLPKILFQAMGLFNPNMRDMAQMYYQYTEPQIVSSKQFEQAFYWKATPLDEAVRTTAEWFREQQKNT